MKLVFIGIQWSGKGTLARKLVENHGFTLIEMGTELRKMAVLPTKEGKYIKEIIEKWYHVPPEIIKTIIQRSIGNNNNANIIFDGFIRNKENKDAMDELCPDYVGVFFVLSVEKAKERLLGRMYDPITHETFPAWTYINPKTWTVLQKREDDSNEESIARRINMFFTHTMPVVQLLKQEWKIIEIDASKEVQHVYRELIEKLHIV